MIKADVYKCNLCGLCTRICHEYCLHIEKNILTIDHAYCSTCTQCIAVCPESALSWDGVEPKPYERALYPGSEQVRELFMERRTNRDFTTRKIDRLLLEEIAGMAIYAPTHNFDLRVVIVDDEGIIGLMDHLIYKFSLSIYKWLYRPRILHKMVKIFSPRSEFEYLKVKPKLEKIKNRGYGFKTMPAAVIFIIGEKIPLSLESAQYALYNIDLYAQSKGLACRNLVGNQVIFNRSRKLKTLLSIGRNEKIFGTISLGYPAIKFKNKVYGKKMDIRWNAMKRDDGEF